MARSDKNRDAALRVAVRKVKRALKRRIALRRRRRSPAKFVGVTGSSAKSTTVTLLSHVLASQGPTRMQVFYNSYFPVQESMLQLKGDEAFSVNELGAGTEGFGAAAQMIGPDLAIVTMISMEHRSIYKTEDNITREKAQLVEALRPGGIALLNGDDPQVMTMAETAEGRQARVVTFGQGDEVGYRATRIHAAWPDRLSLSLEWAGGTLDLKTQFVGSHFWLPVTAAAAAALELGVPPAVVAERIAGVKPLQNRCDTLQIDGGPNFILDTAKAPARTLSLTLDMLRNARAPFKRFILYGVSDFGGNNRQQYSRIYSAAREVADEVIILGDRAKHARASEEDIAAGRFRSFPDVTSLTHYLKETARPDELILLKASGNLHLERAALAFREEVNCWEEKCGRTHPCHDCRALTEGYSPLAARRQRNSSFHPRDPNNPLYQRLES